MEKLVSSAYRVPADGLDNPDYKTGGTAGVLRLIRTFGEAWIS
jgi:hypothetical protein